MNGYNPQVVTQAVNVDIHGNPIGPVLAPQLVPASQTDQTVPRITKEELYKKIRKFDADTVKQLLFYQSLLLCQVRLFFDFDDDDAYNFLTDQIYMFTCPVSQLNHLVNLKTYSSIPDSFLNWFSDDLRAGLYFASYVNLDWVQDCYYGGIEFLYWIKSIIKVSNLYADGHISISPNMNTNPASRENNIKSLTTMKKIYLSNHTRPKIMDWFKAEDMEQVKWAYEYLLEDNKIIFNGTFFPKTIKDKYNLVLATIDLANDIEIKHTVPNGKNELNFTDRGFFIYKMRRAWGSILTTRKKAKQKSERSITVNQDNYDHLLKLSAHYDLAPNRMINRLIEEKYLLIVSDSEQA